MKKVNCAHITFIVFIAVLIISCGQTNQNKKEKQHRMIQKGDSTTQNTPQQKALLFSDDDALAGKSHPKNQIKYYYVDQARSIISWFCVTHTGYMKFKDGKVGVVNNRIISAQFSVKMDSIRDTDIDYHLMRDVLTNTLKSADFFDVKQYPTSSFTLTHLKKQKGSFYLAKGQLQIKDIKKAIQFKSSISVNDTSVMIVSERFPIDRTRWGITIYSKNYEQTDDSFLFTDMVDLQVSLRLKVRK